jgi:hypothetical protein
MKDSRKPGKIRRKSPPPAASANIQKTLGGRNHREDDHWRSSENRPNHRASDGHHQHRHGTHRRQLRDHYSAESWLRITGVAIVALAAAEMEKWTRFSRLLSEHAIPE